MIMQISEEVKTSDHDRWLTSMFADENRREAIHILYAFNLEVAKIYEMVSDPMPGMVRLQWWRESIEEIYEGKTPRKHEIAEPLANIIVQHNLSQKYFMAIIDGHEHDLDEEPFEHIAALEDYTKNTSSSLLMLVLEILGQNDEKLKQTAEHIAISWGITGLLRSAYIHIPKGRFTIFPLSLMNDVGISKDNYGGEKFLEGSKTIVEKLVGYAKFHIEKARKLRGGIDKETFKSAMPVLLLGSLADNYLKQIEKNKYDIFTRKYDRVSPSAIAGLYIKAIIAKY